ncbi:MAG: hypothetical protein N3B21_03165 [Clostridia bacterium]|nr:hypothetical protein [Clostridia bacterium]
MTKKTIILMFMLTMVASFLTSATLEETLNSLTGAAASNYVNPMVSAFGADMNGGWFHKAPRDKVMAWDFEFGIVVMGTMFPDADKSFDVNGRFIFTRAQAQQIASNHAGLPYYNALVDQIVNQTFTVGIKGPTIIGDEYDSNANLNPDGSNPTAINIYFPAQNITFTYNNTTQTESVPSSVIIIPVGGLLKDLPALPLAAPQLSIGTLYGTNLSFRYLPDTELTPEIGSLKYFGWGIQHNPAVWLPFPIPIDAAFAFYTQGLDVGEIIETEATTAGINISKKFGWKLFNVTPYLGAAWESSKMKFNYDYITSLPNDPQPTTITVNFDVEGKNSSRITAGLNFRLAILNLNFDYNIAKYPSATAGAMINLSW